MNVKGVQFVPSPQPPRPKRHVTRRPPAPQERNCGGPFTAHRDRSMEAIWLAY